MKLCTRARRLPVWQLLMAKFRAISEVDSSSSLASALEKAGKTMATIVMKFERQDVQPVCSSNSVYP